MNRENASEIAIAITCVAILAVPWVLFWVNGWDLNQDCDGAVRAPDNFGYWLLIAGVVSGAVAVGAAIDSPRRPLMVATAIAAAAVAVCGIWFLNDGTRVDCPALGSPVGSRF